ncbi:ImcF-related family protein [Orbus sturtevantii]|uniref:ImcF-related family protein n=1 Tax=Orbus sturtevantii TaxID=3074109 RepID=UPI00370D0F0B
MKNKWKILGLVFITLFCAVIFATVLVMWGETLGYSSLGQKIAIWLQGMLLLLALLLTPTIITNSRKLWAKDKATSESLNPAAKKRLAKPLLFAEFVAIKSLLHRHYGFFWRHRVTKCLVLGTRDDSEHLIPNLTTERWQTSNNLLMVYGGDCHEALNDGWLVALKKTFGRLPLLRHKPLDAIIWLLPRNYLTLNRSQQALLEKSIMQIQARNKLVGWQPPIYLVSAQASSWSQAGRVEQGVGILFNSLTSATLNNVDAQIEQLANQCCQLGSQQVTKDNRYAFLLQLSQNLQLRDKPLIKQWLAKWLSLPKSLMPRGLLFSPPATNDLSADEQRYLPEHNLANSPTWQAIELDTKQQPGKREGVDWATLCWSIIIAVMLITCAGVLSSYYNNRALINHSSELVDQLQQQQNGTYSARLQAQYALQLQLEQLIYRQQQGVPIGYRFGLSHNTPLLDTLWHHYLTANDRNIAQPFFNWQTNYLNQLTAMSPADPNRVSLVNNGHQVLKAYLMLTRPDKTDPKYLGEFAGKMWAAPAGISAGEWQKLMPELITFWSQSLIEHPSWAKASSDLLVKDVRQILINQIGVRNAENTIYQAILQRAGQNYSDMTLVKLLGDIDSRTLFSSTDEVSGVFTRKAFEDVVKSEIANAAKLRQEQIDWVLSDGSSSVTSSVSPDSLRQRLTDRYFSDYSAAWLLFLNNIQWRQADNVADVIEQLTLMSDVRQSPLLALMNAVKYQAEVAYSGGGISDNLIRSAQELVKDKNPASLNAKVEASGPLTPTFGPLLNLMNASNNSNDLGLQTYLLRVTQVRLKLQNITSSANPQAMAKQLAKSVFQGTSVDLTETRDYGNLIAANLGEEWSGLGYSLFKQPLEQAWQVILTPAARSFNDTWHNQIAYEWERSFAGRYPFKESESDASFAELARFLRPGSGIIDQFISTELGGVLEKQGGKWVINPVNSQGLTFSPQFIATLDLFNSLSAQLFSSGDAQLAFDLMARSGYNVARSELIINKQKLDYFNQMSVWQRFNWPGDGYFPYAQLSYSSDQSSLQLYQYSFGDWAWLRLLESAAIKQIDSSRYELLWHTPGSHELKYILRTQSGDGPLALLKLRQFALPKTVFDIAKSASQSRLAHKL